MQAPRYKAGDAVVAAADCFLSLESLRSRFDPFAVMDFCAGIDTTVLHDRLYTFGLPDPADNPALGALIDDGVLADLADTGLMRLQPEAMLTHPMAQPVIKLLLAIRADAIQLSYSKRALSPDAAAEVVTLVFPRSSTGSSSWPPSCTT
jgi:hypothetical protein